MAQPREAVPSFRDKNGLFDFARQFTGSLRGTMREVQYGSLHAHVEIECGRVRLMG
jgi:hypothetical protein